MAKDQKPVEELSGIAKQSMDQARGAVDVYFDALEHLVSAYPTGGTAVGEKLKSYAEKDVATTHNYVKQLSQAKDFPDIVRIQTEFVKTLTNAFGEQTTGLAEACTKAASDVLKTPLSGVSS
jgi:hypothetical protein